MASTRRSVSPEAAGAVYGLHVYIGDAEKEMFEVKTLLRDIPAEFSQQILANNGIVPALRDISSRLRASIRDPTTVPAARFDAGGAGGAGGPGGAGAADRRSRSKSPAADRDRQLASVNVELSTKQVAYTQLEQQLAKSHSDYDNMRCDYVSANTKLFGVNEELEDIRRKYEALLAGRRAGDNDAVALRRHNETLLVELSAKDESWRAKICLQVRTIHYSPLSLSLSLSLSCLPASTKQVFLSFRSQRQGLSRPSKRSAPGPTPLPKSTARPTARRPPRRSCAACSTS